MTKPRDWNGRSYDKVSGPMERLGLEVLDRLALRGDERVLDAGCGSGRVTQALIDRLPDGEVIGVDGSRAMIDAARERLPPGTELLVQDLTQLDLQGRTVDAILSTATFHWIADHDALFAALRRALEPGGRLTAQCGGHGNIAGVRAALDQVCLRPAWAPHLGGWAGTWNFSTPEVTTQRLEAAGFAEVRAQLVSRPVTPEEPHEYLGTIVLGAHLERLPAERRDAFVADVVEALRARDGDVVVDYVRLNLDAVAV
ncbi:MAG: Methyltransferase type 11 [Solirubrobacterales bacterium]|nr:Methyltransferase type 11 [Solirubrobacterales bacterium]